MIVPVAIKRWRTILAGDFTDISLTPCTIALDGERTFTVLEGQTAQVTLSAHGPRVVSVEAALREAALRGVFTSVGLSAV